MASPCDGLVESLAKEAAAAYAGCLSLRAAGEAGLGQRLTVPAMAAFEGICIVNSGRSAPPQVGPAALERFRCLQHKKK